MKVALQNPAGLTLDFCDSVRAEAEACGGLDFFTEVMATNLNLSIIEAVPKGKLRFLRRTSTITVTEIVSAHIYNLLQDGGSAEEISKTFVESCACPDEVFAGLGEKKPKVSLTGKIDLRREANLIRAAAKAAVTEISKLPQLRQNLTHEINPILS